MVILKGHKKSYRGRWALVCMVAMAIMAGAVGTSFSNESTVYASPYCTSEACKAAEAAEAEAEAAASAAKVEVDNYGSQIAAKQAEIDRKQAAINADRARAADLQREITKNQQKLDEEQEALAMLLVDMHFGGDNSVLMILAGSETISDLAERQTRRETVQTQVTYAANAVRERKETLEEQKIQVEANIADAEAQQRELEQEQQELAQWKAVAENSMADFQMMADEARAIKEAEIEIARQAMIQAIINAGGGATGVIVDPGLDSYALALNAATGLSCPGSNWRYSYAGYTAFRGGYVCECTSYAGYKAWEYWGYSIGVWGDANNWGNAASSRGLRVDSDPAAHTIGYYTSGYWGHVVWIESVNGDGTVNYSEYNGNVVAGFSYVTSAPAWKFRYIHFD